MRTMTRAEYQMEFGVAPVFTGASVLDNEMPAPRRMTRAEYNTEFGVKPEPNLVEKTMNYVNEFNPFYQIPKMAIEGGMKFGESLGKIATSKTPTDIAKGTIGATAGLSQGALAVPFGTFEAATNLPGVKQVKNLLMNPERGLSKAIGEQVGKSEKLQQFTQQNPNAPEVASDILTTGFGLAAMKGAKSPKLKSDIQADYQRAYEGAKKQVATFKDTRQATVSQNIADEIANIESQYSKLRKANEFSKDAEASRLRIAQADVLPGVVDSSGTINAKQAAEAYYNKTLEGKEAVVRDNLIRLGEKANLEQARSEMVLEINRSGLEGADLLAAMRNINKEIAGLKIRADEFGDVPLEIYHDAKINTTKNIDYNTPPEVKTYRKAVARAYKQVVENNSSFNVKEVNNELSKYYGDYERLLNLEGKKVKGGRLGKYVAQIGGQIVGGAAGGAIGGLPGAAIGAVIGGETSAFLKGKTMEGTFGRERGLEIPKNPILEKAGETAKLPPAIDLKTPDFKVGAPKNILKTKEVLKLERDIAKNVEQQKAAISKGNFTLVATLKEIYKVLVTKLKEIVRAYKESNKQAGFIKNPFSQSSKTHIPESEQMSKQLSSYKSTTPDIKSKANVGISDSISKAKASGQSFDEWVKGQTSIYHGTTKTFEKFDPELSPGGSAWFTDSRKALETGQDVGLNRAAGETVKIMDRYIKPGLKLVDRGTPEGKKLADDLMTGQLESQGYRGIIHEADAKRGRYVELFYPNEDALTRSQLKAEWDKIK